MGRLAQLFPLLWLAIAVHLGFALATLQVRVHDLDDNSVARTFASVQEALDWARFSPNETFDDARPFTISVAGGNLFTGAGFVNLNATGLGALALEATGDPTQPTAIFDCQ